MPCFNSSFNITLTFLVEGEISSPFTNYITSRSIICHIIIGQPTCKTILLFSVALCEVWKRPKSLKIWPNRQPLGTVNFEPCLHPNNSSRSCTVNFIFMIKFNNLCKNMCNYFQSMLDKCWIWGCVMKETRVGHAYVLSCIILQLTCEGHGCMYLCMPFRVFFFLCV